MEIQLPIWEMAARLALGVTLGGLIGWERESRGKVAGLRTHMMVCLGAATFTLMTSAFVSVSSSADPTRIVTGVATGIGFLGAGSILRSERDVEGLTTAAGIWVAGAIGAACGVGAYPVGVITTVIALAVLSVFSQIEKRLRS